MRSLDQKDIIKSTFILVSGEQQQQRAGSYCNAAAAAAAAAVSKQDAGIMLQYA